MEGVEVEQLWTSIKNELLKCRDELVPSKDWKARRYPLWMNRKIVKMIKK